MSISQTPGIGFGSATASCPGPSCSPRRTRTGRRLQVRRRQRIDDVELRPPGSDRLVQLQHRRAFRDVDEERLLVCPIGRPALRDRVGRPGELLRRDDRVQHLVLDAGRRRVVEPQDLAVDPRRPGRCGPERRRPSVTVIADAPENVPSLPSAGDGVRARPDCVGARERDRPVTLLVRMPAFPLVDPVPGIAPRSLRDLRVHRSNALDPRSRGIRLQHVPGRADLREAVALLVRLIPVEVPGRREDRLLQLYRRRREAVLQRRRDEERTGARRHRRGHRRPLDHLVARRQLVRPRRRRRPRTGSPTCSTRATSRARSPARRCSASGRRPHAGRETRTSTACPPSGDFAIVRVPRVAGLVRAAADRSVRGTRRAGGVRTGAVVALREEELHAAGSPSCCRR